MSSRDHYQSLPLLDNIDIKVTKRQYKDCGRDVRLCEYLVAKTVLYSFNDYFLKGSLICTDGFNIIPTKRGSKTIKTSDKSFSSSSLSGQVRKNSAPGIYGSSNNQSHYTAFAINSQKGTSAKARRTVRSANDTEAVNEDDVVPTTVPITEKGKAQGGSEIPKGTTIESLTVALERERAATRKRSKFINVCMEFSGKLTVTLPTHFQQKLFKRLDEAPYERRVILQQLEHNVHQLSLCRNTIDNLLTGQEYLIQKTQDFDGKDNAAMRR
ncbi:MAG: hypothetical protein M1813_001767 [Trichoglossum hirsutum]|nr:MAG: hypothetical protein M1813_001767 [Trichoglossum hirsutum]